MMKKRYKRIIAREFLILIGTAIIFIIAYFIWNILHKYNISKKHSIENQISKTWEIEPYVSLKKFSNLYEDDAVLRASTWESTIANYPELKNYSENDLKDYALAPELGFSAGGLPNNIDSKIYFENIERLQEIKNSFFNQKITTSRIKNLIFILLGFVFLFRYVLYGKKWSITQLKG